MLHEERTVEPFEGRSSAVSTSRRRAVDPDQLGLAGGYVKTPVCALTCHFGPRPDCEPLRDHPTQPTRELRSGTRLGDPSKKLATERALVELQRRFLVCKVDLTGRTRGTYSYVWDLAERFWPQAFVEARHTSPTAARSKIRSQLREFGLALSPQLDQHLFLWT